MIKVRFYLINWNIWISPKNLSLHTNFISPQLLYSMDDEKLLAQKPTWIQNPNVVFVGYPFLFCFDHSFDHSATCSQDNNQIILIRLSEGYKYGNIINGFSDDFFKLKKRKKKENGCRRNQTQFTIFRFIFHSTLCQLLLFSLNVSTIAWPHLRSWT